jgi:hypothetical protein
MSVVSVSESLTLAVDLNGALYYYSEIWPSNDQYVGLEVFSNGIYIVEQGGNMTATTLPITNLKQVVSTRSIS